jgi:hypothetical protein
MKNWIILAVIVCGIKEGSAYLVGKYLQNLPGRGIFCTPHVTETYQEYSVRKDPQLGWPSSSSFAKNDFDSSGSRIIPSYPDPATNSCVSIYGDSFAWGTEVDSEHAWSNVLSQLLHCRAANYGVPAYGTDQAYMRFHVNSGDTAPVVILTHLSEGITRNVGQFRNLAAPSPLFFLKPRFTLGEKGNLQLLPVPSLNEAQYQDLQKNPQQYLTHEFFLPGGESGTQKLQFPYTLSLIRLYKRLYILEGCKGNHAMRNFTAMIIPRTDSRLPKKFSMLFTMKHSQNTNIL